MYKKLIMLIILVFGLGWISHLMYSEFSSGNRESPLGLVQDTLFPGKERASPHDWIKQNQIHLSNHNVSFDVANPQWAVFTNTNSMDPVIDENTHAIEIIPETKEDIHVGDIVSYKLDGFDGVVIHRVIEVGNDGEWYALMKGDNNTIMDPDKVRFNQIERVLVAIIY